MTHRTVVSLAAAVLSLGTLAGCGSASSSSTGSAEPHGAQHTMADGMVMDGSSMPAVPQDSGQGGATGPSKTARLICGDEIREAVAKTLGRSQVPQGLHLWADRTFTCSYRIGSGDLRLSVKDIDSAAPGRAYFDDLRQRLPGARMIKGLQNLGFRAFEDSRGDVAFLKDHKTLWVDGSHLPRTALPAGVSRTEAAYGVAAEVIACWQE